MEGGGEGLCGDKSRGRLKESKWPPFSRFALLFFSSQPLLPLANPVWRELSIRLPTPAGPPPRRLPRMLEEGGV